jgi:hypothetical protein
MNLFWTCSNNPISYCWSYIIYPINRQYGYVWLILYASSCFSYPGLLRKESCLRRITASLEPKMASHTLFSIISVKLDRKFQEKWWITIFLGFHFATFVEITTMTFPGDWNKPSRLDVDSTPAWREPTVRRVHNEVRHAAITLVDDPVATDEAGSLQRRCGDPSLILPTKVTKQVDFFQQSKCWFFNMCLPLFRVLVEHTVMEYMV